MALPRSTTPSATMAANGLKTSATVLGSAIAAGATLLLQVPVGRHWSIHKSVDTVFATQPMAGLQVGEAFITGNSPTSGATPAGYTANIEITNTTAASLTPVATKITLIQR